MAYSGRYTPKNPSKYLGDPTQIFYRSLWERRVMEHLDDNVGVVEWSSEEIVIPYLSPVDGKWHRYFPDFFARTKAGAMVIEVKPMEQSVAPEPRKRVTRGYIKEVMTYGVNQAKWKAANEYCLDRGWSFKVLTEQDIFKK